MNFNPVGMGRLDVVENDRSGFDSKFPVHHQSDIIETGMICMKDMNRQDGQKRSKVAATK
jgi:hypothetical protein